MSRNPLLVEILTGHASPSAAELTDDEILVGRGQGCQVRLHPTKDILCASKTHFRLVRRDAKVGVVCEHVNGLMLECPGSDPVYLAQGEERDVEGNFEVVIGSDGPRLSVHHVGEQLPGTYREKSRRKGALLQPVGRVSGETVVAAHMGRRAAKIGLPVLAVVVMLGAGWVVYSRAEMKKLREQRNAEVDKIVGEQQQIRRAFETPAAIAPLQQAMKAAGSSVFRVEQNGRLLGTAWLAADHRLVTNAHVARLIDFDSDTGPVANREGLRSPLKITNGVEQHPAFEMWRSVMTQQSVLIDGEMQPVNLVVAGDIAVLPFEGDPEAAPLALSDSPSSVGDAIVYFGYPHELQAGLPTLQTVTGSITAVTDPFFRSNAGAEKLLIHTTAFAAGGASGSPVLGPDGRVIGVISAGSTLLLRAEAGSPRIFTGINYAQGVEFVNELLERRADERQSLRNQTWRERIKEAFVSPSDRLERETESLSQEWYGSQMDQVTDTQITLERPPQAGGKTSIARRNFDLEAGYHYIFLAAPLEWSDLTIAVSETGLSKAQLGVAYVVAKQSDSPRRLEVVLQTPHIETPDSSGGKPSAPPVVQLRVVRVKR